MMHRIQVHVVTKKIDILQRTLTALNLRVKTVAQTDYQAGMIKQGHYTGVITMVNWSAVGITNKTFIRDRDAYRGIKLHIGDGLTAKEASELGATKMVLYQQQMALKTAKTSKSLPFKQAITVLTHQSSDAVMYGRLVTPDGNVDYAYGTVNHHDAYLPFFLIRAALDWQRVSSYWPTCLPNKQRIARY